MSLSIWNTTGGRNITQYTQWSRPKPEHFANSVKSCTKAMEVVIVIGKEAARSIWIFFLGFKRTNVGNLSRSLDSVRVKCRDQTVVNNLFKLSNLIDKFFIRIKHSKNKQNRVH